jgi:hypothetical protein
MPNMRNRLYSTLHDIPEDKSFRSYIHDFCDQCQKSLNPRPSILFERDILQPSDRTHDHPGRANIRHEPFVDDSCLLSPELISSNDPYNSSKTTLGNFTTSLPSSHMNLDLITYLYLFIIFPSTHSFKFASIIHPSHSNNTQVHINQLCYPIPRQDI